MCKDSAATQTRPADQAVLRTERLTLRPPRDGDAHALVGLLDDIDVVRYTEHLPHPYTLKDARAFITAQRHPGGHGIQDARMACLGDPDGEVVGSVGYRGSAPPEMEIGYWVGQRFWGRGYAREIAAAALDHAFEVLGAQRITADAVAANAASHRVLTALGFVDEGETTCATRALGDQPALRRSHTATSWREARARLTGGGRS